VHKHHASYLGGVMVSVLAIGPKVRWFNPGRGDEILRMIKIRSTPSFEWQVKPEAPSRNIVRHIQNSLGKYEQKYCARKT
jgi:hypothetical protein